jgi:alkylation response protein AidB-like acyl-CoA dehydrogenase
MTDGAATVLRNLMRAKKVAPQAESEMKQAYLNLISSDPDKFWTSGQWMTEKRGGSDVGNATETVYIEQDSIYKLYGYKWFTSAIDADMTLTLARKINEDGQVVHGSKGLRLFFAKLNDEEGSLNGIKVVRLKDKLGTR